MRARQEQSSLTARISTRNEGCLSRRQPTTDNRLLPSFVFRPSSSRLAALLELLHSLVHERLLFGSIGRGEGTFPGGHGAEAFPPLVEPGRDVGVAPGEGRDQIVVLLRDRLSLVPCRIGPCSRHTLHLGVNRGPLSVNALLVLFGPAYAALHDLPARLSRVRAL